MLQIHVVDTILCSLYSLKNEIHTLRRRHLLRLSSRVTGQTKEVKSLSMGVAINYYTFKHSPCCFPTANEASFWYLWLS